MRCTTKPGCLGEGLSSNYVFLDEAHESHNGHVRNILNTTAENR